MPRYSRGQAESSLYTYSGLKEHETIRNELFPFLPFPFFSLFLSSPMECSCDRGSLSVRQAREARNGPQVSRSGLVRIDGIVEGRAGYRESGSIIADNNIHGSPSSLGGGNNNGATERACHCYRSDSRLLISVWWQEDGRRRRRRRRCSVHIPRGLVRRRVRVYSFCATLRYSQGPGPPSETTMSTYPTALPCNRLNSIM